MPRALSINRQAKTVALDDRLCEIVRARHPQTVRQVYYRAVALQLVEKNQRGYEEIGRRLLWLRLRGHIPYEWIVDAGRSARSLGAGTHNIARILDNAASRYSHSPWIGREEAVVVAVESRSLGNLLGDTAAGRWVSFYPFGGQPSITMVRDLSRRWRGSMPDARSLRILYVGDYDPAGLTIEESTSAHLSETFGVPHTWERLAITAEQAEVLHAQGLSTPRKGTGHPEVRYAVESEAMDADDMVDLLKDRLAELLPVDVQEATESADAARIADIRRLAKHVGDHGLDAVLAQLDTPDQPLPPNPDTPPRVEMLAPNVIRVEPDPNVWTEEKYARVNLAHDIESMYYDAWGIANPGPDMHGEFADIPGSANTIMKRLGLVRENMRTLGIPVDDPPEISLD